MKVTWAIVWIKQEMTRIWKDNKQIPVTLIKLVDQEVIRYKTIEQDGYSAVVIWLEKKEVQKEKGQTVSWTMVKEFHVDPLFADSYPVGTAITSEVLGDASRVRVMSRSKGKGFQWVMKRHNFAGGPATHGSKFHRAWWSTGNRKPRRTIRWWKMAGHMGDENITLKSVPLVDIWHHEGDTFVVMKWSIPGAYNTFVQLLVD